MKDAFIKKKLAKEIQKHVIITKMKKKEKAFKC